MLGEKQDRATGLHVGAQILKQELKMILVRYGMLAFEGIKPPQSLARQARCDRVHMYRDGFLQKMLKSGGRCHIFGIACRYGPPLKERLDRFIHVPRGGAKTVVDRIGIAQNHQRMGV